MKGCGGFIVSLCLLLVRGQELTCEEDIRLNENERNKVISSTTNTCWKVFVPASHRVRIHFARFNLTKGYDFLEIGDLWDSNIEPDSRLAKFGGDQRPTDVVSISPGAWIRLSLKSHISRHRSPDISINISFESATEVDIELTRDSPEEVIEKDVYHDNEYLFWHVKAPPTFTIRFTVRSLHLEEEYDFVFFGNEFGVPFRSSGWCKLTGYLGNNAFQSNSNQLFIIFSADATKQKTGFNFSFKAVPKSSATETPSASCFSQTENYNNSSSSTSIPPVSDKQARQGNTSLHNVNSSNSTSFPAISDMQARQAHPVQKNTSLRIVIAVVVISVVAILAALNILMIIFGTRRYRRKHTQASSNSYISDDRFSSDESDFSSSFSSGSMILHDSTEDLFESTSPEPSSPLETELTTGSEQSILSSQTRSHFVMNRPQRTLPSGSSENLSTSPQVQIQRPEVTDFSTFRGYSDDEIGIANVPSVAGKMRHSYFIGQDCSSIDSLGPEMVACPLLMRKCDSNTTAGLTDPMKDDNSFQDEGHRSGHDIDNYVDLRCSFGKDGLEDKCLPVYSMPSKGTKTDFPFGNAPSSNVYLVGQCGKNDMFSQRDMAYGRAIEAINPCYRLPVRAPCGQKELYPDDTTGPLHLPDPSGSVESLIDETPAREQTHVTNITHSAFSSFGQTPQEENQNRQKISHTYFRGVGYRPSGAVTTSSDPAESQNRQKITHTYFHGVGFRPSGAVTTSSDPVESIYDEAHSNFKLTAEDYFETLEDVIQELQTVEMSQKNGTQSSKGNQDGRKIQHTYFSKEKFKDQCHEGIPVIAHESLYDDATSHHPKHLTPSHGLGTTLEALIDTQRNPEASEAVPAITPMNTLNKSQSATNSSFKADYASTENHDSTIVRTYFCGVKNVRSSSGEESNFDDSSSPDSLSYRHGKTAAIVRKFEILGSTTSLSYMSATHSTIERKFLNI